MVERTRERRSRERAEHALAWTFTGLAAIAVAGVLWLYFATELDDTYLLFSGVVGLSFPVVGATVLTRRPGHAIGWIFVAIGAGMSLAGFVNGYAAYSLTVLPDPLLATGIVAWLSGWFWVPSFGLFMTFALLLFPDGHLPSPRWRPIAYLAAGSIAVTMADFAVSSWLDPYASVYAPQTVGSPMVLVWFGLLSASGLASAASLVVRFRRSRGEERLQLKWVAYAAALTVAIVVPAIAVTRGASPSLIIVVAAPLVPVAAGVAILRYRLLRHRPPHQPHPRLRLPHRNPGTRLLRWRNPAARGSASPHGPRDHPGCCRLHPPDSGAVCTLKTAHPVLHRQALLQEEVRRREDPGGVRGQAARRDRPRGA